jgi:4-diphosphocytidyl-2-C-methyl-D-erythritol kinase
LPSPRTAEAFAPAKVNLALHVTGRRADGYHLLDSLVVFAGIGDRLTATLSDEPSFTVSGPCAEGVPTDDSNLVMRALSLFEPAPSLAISLRKEIPPAAGIGGGSSDAAAAIRLASQLTGEPLPAVERLLSLGADLPVCMAGRPCRMRGIGERIELLPPLPSLWILLVNPRVAVPTGKVFSTLDRADNAPMDNDLPRFRDAAGFSNWLADQRNDLEAPARQIEPLIDVLLTAISETEGCILARMSGSGATCFGLFDREDRACSAAASVARRHPEWWVRAGAVLS